MSNNKDQNHYDEWVKDDSLIKSFTDSLEWNSSTVLIQVYTQNNFEKSLLVDSDGEKLNNVGTAVFNMVKVILAPEGNKYKSGDITSLEDGFFFPPQLGSKPGKGGKGSVPVYGEPLDKLTDKIYFRDKFERNFSEYLYAVPSSFIQLKHK